MMPIQSSFMPSQSSSLVTVREGRGVTQNVGPPPPPQCEGSTTVQVPSSHVPASTHHVEAQPTVLGFHMPIARAIDPTAATANTDMHGMPHTEAVRRLPPALPPPTGARTTVSRPPLVSVGDGGGLQITHVKEENEPGRGGVLQNPLSLGFLTQHVEKILEEREKRNGNSPPSSMGGSVRFERPQSHVPQGGVPMMPFGIGTPMGVGVVGVGGANHFSGMMGYPHMAHMWAEISKPTLFEDRPSQWDQFDREWRKYEQLTTATGFPMPDPIKLAVLKSRVGEVT